MEQRSAESYEKKKQYSIDYAKQKYKRIPLDVTIEKYDEIRDAATASGESINGFIKKAIDKRIAEK